jgi:hypothetical protein
VPGFNAVASVARGVSAFGELTVVFILVAR